MESIMTGLEASWLVGMLSKAVGVGVARTAGWGATSLLSARRRSRIAKHLGDTFGVRLSDVQSASLAKFVAAPEMEHFAAALVQLYLLRDRDSSALAALSKIENEFYFALAAWLGGEPPTDIARVLYRALNEAVLQTISEFDLRRKLPPSLEAEVMKTIASLATASVRNAELLQGINHLHDIIQFQEEYTSQARALHATMSLPHAGTTRRVPYDELFVPPRLIKEAAALEFRPRRQQSTSSPSNPFEGSFEAQALEDFVSLTTRLVILGDPGGGKSTLAYKLVYDSASGSVSALHGKAPFLIVVRDYAAFVRGDARMTVAQYIAKLCQSPYNVPPPFDAIEYLLLNGRALVIFDGLDELLDTSLRRDVVQAVEGFAHRYPTCSIVVTSRRIGYEQAPLDQELFISVGLCNFNIDQTALYVKRWFALNDAVSSNRHGQLAEAFMRDSAFVPDLRTNPLMLSLMCGIYATEGYIPHNRPDVYEKCAVLLFESWDKQRGIKPTLPFDAHVRAAMRSLALYMFIKHPSEPALPRDLLVGHIRDYLREKRFSDDVAAENAATDFIDFCKGRAWVLTDLGADLYGFTHRTFLEYFAASQLVRQNASASALFDQLRRHLLDQSWDVVSQLALQILNKTVEDGADDFLDLVLDAAEDDSLPPKSQLVMMSFAARSLQFIVPRPTTLTRIVEVTFSTAVALFVDPRPVADIAESGPRPFTEMVHSASRENAPRIGSELRRIIHARLTGSSDNRSAECALFVALMPTLDGRPGYWRNWARESARLYSLEIIRRRKSYWWLALFEYEAGHASIADVIANAGAGVLYRQRVGWQPLGVPYAYSIFRELLRDLRNQELDRSRAEVRLDVGFFLGLGRERRLDVALLLEALYTSPVPWLDSAEDAELLALADAMFRHDLSPHKRSNDVRYRLRELLLLPLFELIIETRGGSRITDHVRSSEGMLAARLQRHPPKPLGHDRHDLFLSKWATGEISLMRRDSGDVGHR
jgi:hypothetical protein